MPSKLAAIAVLATSGLVMATRSGGRAPSRDAAPRLHSSSHAMRHDVWFEPKPDPRHGDALFVAIGPDARFREGGAQFRVPAGEAMVDLDLTLVGHRNDVHVHGADVLPGVSHYYLGGDTSKWRTSVPHYGSVEYERAWDGIDATFHATGPDLEYDFRIAPAADPSAIRLRFENARRLRVDNAGALTIETPTGIAHQRAPYAYQEATAGRQAVPVRYAIRGDRDLAFTVGAYDHQRPLVIDPVLAFGTYVDTTQGARVGLDAADNAYITGWGSNTVVTTKWAPDGQLLYRTEVASSNSSAAGTGIAVDAVGHAWVVGVAYQPAGSFPVSDDAFRKGYAGGVTDAFLLRLSPSGLLEYSTLFGGSGDEYDLEVALGPGGAPYVSGSTSSTDFPVLGAIQPASAGKQDAFVTKFDASGRHLVYSTYLGGSDDDRAFRIAVDGGGRAFVGGLTTSTNFPVVAPVQGTYGGNVDGFAARIDATGAHLQMSTYLGGSDYDEMEDLAIDSHGALYCGGLTFSSNFPGMVTSGSSGFLVKLTDAGLALSSGAFGLGRGIAVGSDDAVYLTGAHLAGRVNASFDGWEWTFGNDDIRGRIAVAADGSVFVTGRRQADEINDDDSFPTFHQLLSEPPSLVSMVVARIVPGTATMEHEETDPAISYAGQWTFTPEASASGGQIAASSDPTATATITFTGTGIQVYGRRAPEGGVMKTVRPDAAGWKLMTSLKSTPEARALLFSITGMPLGSHQLLLRKYADIPGVVWIDGFTALTDGPMPTATPTPQATAGATATASATAAPGATATVPSSAPPFGFFDTPQDGTTNVSGAVAVTGWALDDTSVAHVDIYRDPVAGDAPPSPNGKIFIGIATFVPGARPDVAALYPTYPHADRAAWGYMLLTNMLPDVGAHKAAGGNGAFTLYAYATDDGGNTTLLGARRFTAQNTGAVKPFGTIDTPTQGETVSGVINNFGWVLTPMPASVPTDGSTITLFIDGVAKGHAQYNLFRDDIATIFPGYANTQGAIGFFSIDTRTLSNGVHTLAWSVSDDGGHTDGIGSRYFTVVN
jgi:hypothetical protein